MVFVEGGTSVGASTSIFGLTGAYIGLLVCTWPLFNDRSALQRERKWTLFIFLSVYLVSNFMMASQNKHIDQLGHAGGLISGSTLMMMLYTHEQG
jgi:membrane associated rhomboid family serine protease